MEALLKVLPKRPSPQGMLGLWGLEQVQAPALGFIAHALVAGVRGEPPGLSRCMMKEGTQEAMLLPAMQ